MSTQDEAARMGLFGMTPAEPTPAQAGAATRPQAQAEPQPRTTAPAVPAAPATPAPTPVAPAAPAAPATTAFEPVDELDDDEVASPARLARRPDVHQRRRRTAVTVMACVAVLGLWFVARPSHADQPTAGSTPGASASASDPQAASADAASTLEADLKRAAAFHQERGTYRGFEPTAPGSAATGRDVVVLVLSTSQGCFYTGVAPGFDGTVKSDPTGKHCQASELTTVQSELDSNDAATSSADTAAATKRLDQAVDVAQFWGAQHLVGGEPDFSSLVGTELVSGATATGVGHGGQTVLVTTEVSSHRCEVAEVSLTGSSTSTKDC